MKPKKSKGYKYTDGVFRYFHLLLLKRKAKKTISKLIKVRCIYSMKKDDLEYLESINDKE
jgi:hypothetical protein